VPQTVRLTMVKSPEGCVFSKEADPAGEQLLPPVGLKKNF